MDTTQISDEPVVTEGLIYELSRKEGCRKAYWESFYKKYQDCDDEDEGVGFSTLAHIRIDDPLPKMKTSVESKPKRTSGQVVVVRVLRHEKSSVRKAESSVSSLPDSVTSKEDDVRRWLELNEQQFAADALTVKYGLDEESKLGSEELTVNTDPQTDNIINQANDLNNQTSDVTNNQADDVIEFDSDDDTPNEQPAKPDGQVANCIFLDNFNVEYFRNLGMEWKPSANALIKEAEDYKSKHKDKSNDNEEEISESVAVKTEPLPLPPASSTSPRRRSNRTSRQNTDLPFDNVSLPIVRPLNSSKSPFSQTYGLSVTPPETQGTLVGLNKSVTKEGQLDKSFPMELSSKIPVVLIDSTEIDIYLNKKQEEFEQDTQCINVEDNNIPPWNIAGQKTVSIKSELIKTEKMRGRDSVPFQTRETNFDAASKRRDIEVEVVQSGLQRKDKKRSFPLKKVTFAWEKESSSKTSEMEVSQISDWRGVSLPMRRSKGLSVDCVVVSPPLQVSDEPGETSATLKRSVRMKLASESTNKQQKVNKKSFGDEIEIVKEVQQNTKQNVCPLHAESFADIKELAMSTRNLVSRTSLGGGQSNESSRPRSPKIEPRMLSCLRYFKDPLFKSRRSSLKKPAVVSSQPSVQSNLFYEKTESRIDRGKSSTTNEDGKNKKDKFESLPDVEVQVTSPKGKSKLASGDSVVVLPCHQVDNKPMETMSKRIMKAQSVSIEGGSDSKSMQTSGNEIEIVREVKQGGEIDNIKPYVRRLFPDSSSPVDSPQVLNPHLKSVPPMSAGSLVRRPSSTLKSNVNNSEMENNVERSRNILSENPAMNTIINLYLPENRSSGVFFGSDSKRSKLVEEDYSTGHQVNRKRLEMSLVDAYSEDETTLNDSIPVMDIVVPSSSSDSGSLIFQRKRCKIVTKKVRRSVTQPKSPTIPPKRIDKVSKAELHSKSVSNTGINENIVVLRSNYPSGLVRSKANRASDRKVRNDIVYVESDTSDESYMDHGTQNKRMKSHRWLVWNSKRFRSSSEEEIFVLDGNGNQLGKDRLSVEDKKRNTERMSQDRETNKRLSVAKEKNKVRKQRGVCKRAFDLSSSSADEHYTFLDNRIGRDVASLIGNTVRCSPRKSNSQQPTNGEFILEDQSKGRINSLETPDKKNSRKEEIKYDGKERQRSNKWEDGRMNPEEVSVIPRRQRINVEDDARNKTKRQKDRHHKTDYVPESESDTEVLIVRDVENTGRRGHKAKRNTSPNRPLVLEGSSSVTSGILFFPMNTISSKGARTRSIREDRASVELDEPVIVSDSDVDCW